MEIIRWNNDVTTILVIVNGFVTQWEEHHMLTFLNSTPLFDPSVMALSAEATQFYFGLTVPPFAIDTKMRQWVAERAILCSVTLSTLKMYVYRHFDIQLPHSSLLF